MKFPRLPFEPEPRVWPNDALCNRRYYRIAGITVEVESDIPISDETFATKFRQFLVAGPGADTITIKHHFGLPDVSGHYLGVPVYDRLPWKIYHRETVWIYVCLTPSETETRPCQIAIFSEDHTQASIYHDAFYESSFRTGDLYSLTLFPTDQIVLARVLADRQGYYLHSAGAILNGKAVLFVGHAGAGKSTIAKFLNGHAEILCDDRNIIRRTARGFEAFGSWSHGEVEQVSAASAPLEAILFLRQSSENRSSRIQDGKVSLKKLLACVVRPLSSSEWWEKILVEVDATSKQVPCYDLEFDKSGRVVQLITKLTNTL